MCIACDSLMTEDGSLPIIFKFFPDLRNPFVVNTCKHVSDDNEVYFPKAQKTSWMIQNIFFVYFSTCTYSQGMRVQVLTN